MSAADQLIREDERGRCAALVRGEGCLCAALFASGIFRGKGEGERIAIPGHGEIDILRVIEEHDPACPSRLADRIEREL